MLAYCNCSSTNFMFFLTYLLDNTQIQYNRILGSHPYVMGTFDTIKIFSSKTQHYKLNSCPLKGRIIHRYLGSQEKFKIIRKIVYCY